MLLAALVFSGCQLLVLGCIVLLVRHWIRRQAAALRDEIAETVRTFVSAPDDKTPSPLAAVVDQFALLLAARLVQQVKAMLAGVESGASKGEQLALMQDATSSSPWLALIAGIIPKRLRNQLMRNPQMIGALSKLGGGGNHSTSGGSAPSRDNYSL
jgi:phage-related minor tail protein